MTSLQLISEDKKQVLNHLLKDYLLELLPKEKPVYKFLDSYWQEMDRHPYFIIYKSEIVGFVLINKICKIEQDPTPHSIAEFYIIPAFRKNGIGNAAAHICFNLYPGNWEVQQFSKNLGSIQFWKKVIGAHTDGNFQEHIDEELNKTIQIFKSNPTQ